MALSVGCDGSLAGVTRPPVRRCDWHLGLLGGHVHARRVAALVVVVVVVVGAVGVSDFF